jgi:hypothetical protein
MAGDAGLAFMPDAARVLSQAIPHGQLRTLAGQTHEVKPGVLARSWRSSSFREVITGCRVTPDRTGPLSGEKPGRVACPSTLSE